MAGIRIESVGVCSKQRRKKRSSIDLATRAANECLKESVYEKGDIELLINTGVYRDEFITEPAIATIIQKAVKINPATHGDKGKKTLAFDILNGGIGFMNGCHVAGTMIKSGRFKTALVLTGEIENNAETKNGELLGYAELGAAIILDRSQNPGTGFGKFLFKTFHDHIDSYISHLAQDRGETYIHYKKEDNLEERYLACIPATVEDLLCKEGLQLGDIDIILPPQISSDFIAELSRRIGVARDKLVDLTELYADPFTATMALTFKYSKENNLIKRGDKILFINVGSGIQIGCAIYYC